MTTSSTRKHTLVLAVAVLGITAALPAQTERQAEPQVVFRVRMLQMEPTAADKVAAESLNSRADFHDKRTMNVHVLRDTADVASLVSAEAGRNALEVVSVPTLRTRNGRHARFLAGARNRVPTQPDPFAESSRNPLAPPPGAPEPTAPAVNLPQQDFGLQLNLRPVILSSGLIRVRVNPQVRSVDFGNATSRRGRYVPALSTRQINVTYDVKPGQTIALTGLFDDETMQKLRRTGAAEEGLLKQMLDTADAKPNTDLVLLITPEIVEPPTEQQR